MKKMVFKSILCSVLYLVAFFMYLELEMYLFINPSHLLSPILNYRFFDIEVVLAIVFSIPIIIFRLRKEKYWVYSLAVLCGNFILWLIIMLVGKLTGEPGELSFMLRFMFVNDITVGVVLGLLVNVIINLFARQTKLSY